MNTDDPEVVLLRAEDRMLKIQTKLHRWARDDPRRVFGDLFNLVTDPAFLLVAWDRVRGNKRARTAGVDSRTALSIVLRVGVEEFLHGLRSALKERSFRPLPVREGHSKLDIIRCLKSYLAREIYYLLNPGQPAIPPRRF